MSAKARYRKLFTNPRFMGGAIILSFAAILAIFAPWLALYPPDLNDYTLRLLPPSPEHPFGNDINGGDVLTSILYGARTSLYVSFGTVLLSVSVGLVLGLLAGFFRGKVDALIMRTVDVLMAFPGILLAMALAALLGPSINNVILAIAATGWTSTARLIRGQVLSIAEREFVTASTALGAKPLRLMILHILPGTISPLVIHATFSLSGVIVIEASLSFLGLGASDGAPSWGALLGQGRTEIASAPHLSIIPGICIASLVLALNFMGDSLRDFLDPRD